MTFQFTFEEDGHGRRIVFEEKLDAGGTPHLVVTHLDGEFSTEEMDDLKADALAKWLHPNQPPDVWFE